MTINAVNSIIFVNQANTSGNYDGLTWETAFTDLQDALTNARAGDQIWVAKGTYYPSTTDYRVSFSMKNDVAIYGGFQGNETMLSQRNWKTNETILSGDIDHATDPLVVTGNGSSINFQGYDDNSRSVIVNYSNNLNNTAILDGFTISGGNNSMGGGMLNRNSSPTVTNVIFKYNRAVTFGGGMYNEGSSPSLTNVTFTYNYGALRGGGMYNNINSSPTITNVTFISNVAGGTGGGIHNESGSPIIINSTFYNNYASDGRAIYHGNNTINLYNCILWNNGGGNAIYKNAGAITVTNCLIEPSATSYTLANGTPPTITQDPLFADAANGDFRLKPCSPAIDKGATGSNIPTTDIMDNARFDMPIVGISTVDIGAYETQATPPAKPTVTAPAELSVCLPNTIRLTASCATGTVVWSNSTSDTSLTLSNVGTYAIAATCELAGCSSDPSTTINLEIKAKPSVPVITEPADLIVCSPNTVILTATCVTGTVLWSNSTTGTILTSSSVGTYAITAKCVSNNCESDASTVRNVEIKAKPSVPTVSTPSQSIVCSPNNVILTATCITGTVLWSNSTTDTSLTLSTVGTYAITAKCVSNNCESDASAITNLEIKSKPSVPIVSTPSQSVVCAPNTVSLTATCTIGTVLWSNSATGTLLNVSTVGTHSITATCISNGCSSDASTARNLDIKAEPMAPTLSTPAQSVVCAPNSITLTATCTTGTVLWSNSATGTSLTLSSAGTYGISATCTLGSCTSVASSVVTGLQILAQPNAPTITPPTSLVVCFPNTLVLTASGCAGTVTWSTGSSGTSLTLSSAGTYSISATCIVGSCTSVASSVVTGLQILAQPNAPMITAPITKVVCSPSTLVLTASGCAGTINWSTGSTGTSLTLSSAGTYSISATCTVGSCTSVTSSVVTGLQILAQPNVPTITAPGTKVVCSPNTLVLTASGCAGTVTWSTGSSGTSLTLSNAGTYNISATCTVGSCTSVASSVVTGLQILAQPNAPMITAPGTKVVCSPNTLVLTASGCAGTINWSTGSSGTSLTLSRAGTYSISATCTVGNCTSVASSVVTGLQILAQPNVPTITAPGTKIVCFPSTLTLTASDCAGTINWSTGSSGTSLTLSNAGTYSISATCTVGSCTSVASSVVTGLQILAQPNAPTITAPITKIVCSPNTLVLTASGCAGTVTWSTGSSGTSLTLSNAGTYNISATCTVGSCTSVASSVVTGLQILAQPNTPIITPPISLVVCSPNTLVLTASGCAGTINWSTGSSGTSLTLSSAGTYSISATCTVGNCTSVASSVVTGLQILAQPNVPIITPPTSLVVCSPNTLVLTASGCAGTVTWSTGSSGTSLTLSSAGTYSISATCTVGSCTSVASSVVTGLEILAQPNAPTITPPTFLVVCSPNTLVLTASGCAGTVTWSTGSSGTSLILSSAGTYSISATCTVGNCTSVASSVVTGLQILTQPNVPIITPPTFLVVCSPNTLVLTASGCAGTINWSTGSMGTSLTLSSAGTYSISATCTVGSCTSVASSVVTGLQIVSPPTVTITGSVNLSCNTVSVTRTAYGSGVSPTYQWSNNLGTSGIANITSAGIYTVTVTGTNNCTATATTSVIVESIQPNAPTITVPSTKIVCFPSTLVLTASGCAGTINWSTGSSGTSLTLSSAGTYNISATCTVGSCTSVASSVVTGLQILAQPNAPMITAPGTKVVCSPSTLVLTASGCAGTINWSTGSSGTSLILSSAGTYSISATCTVGSCTSIASSVVTGLEILAQPNVPTITAPGTKVVCSPNTLVLTASGCAGTVTWSTGSSGTSLTLSSAGTYGISVTCTVGSCTSVVSSVVTGLEILAQPNAPTITAPGTKIVCFPSTLVLTASGCAGTINWSTGSSGTSLTLSSAGTYNISATCTVGSCTSVASSVVTGLEILAQPNTPIITPPTSLVVCSPNTLVLTASGCAGTINWSTGSSGTSLTLSSVGNYAITAKCVSNGCESDASSTVNLQIKAMPTVPVVTQPANLVVCSPSTLTLTATCPTGTVLWSNSSTGTSLALSSIGTYAITAKCVSNGCESDASSAVNLQIKPKPNVPVITPPMNLVVCSPGTLTLTTTCDTGTVLWSNSSTGTSLPLSSRYLYYYSQMCIQWL